MWICKRIHVRNLKQGLRILAWKHSFICYATMTPINGVNHCVAIHWLSKCNPIFFSVIRILNLSNPCSFQEYSIKKPFMKEIQLPLSLVCFGKSLEYLHWNKWGYHFQGLISSIISFLLMLLYILICINNTTNSNDKHKKNKKISNYQMAPMKQYNEYDYWLFSSIIMDCLVISVLTDSLLAVGRKSVEIVSLRYGFGNILC